MVKPAVVLLPVATGLRVKETGETLSEPVPATVPESGMECGLPMAESVRTSCAVRVPVALGEGLKLTSSWQEEPPVGTGTVQAGPPEETKEEAKSAALGPEIATFEIVRARSPLLATKTSVLALCVPAA